jgi:diguanylate cyclase (GGDEF)-like protein
MAGEIIKQRYYFLTPLSFLLGILVLVATLLLAVASYQRSIGKTVAGYGHMISSIEAALLHELVLANRRQLAVLEASLDKAAIARGEPADNPIWAIAHQIKLDSYYIYFYNARFDRLSSYPHWERPAEYRADQRPWYKLLSMPGDEVVWFGPYNEFDSSNQILTLIKRVRDADGSLLGLLMVDMSFNRIQQALQRAMGENQAAIYLSQRGSGRQLVGHNLALLPAGLSTGQKPDGLGLSVIWQGSQLRFELADIDWDLSVYLPPTLFHDSLYETLLLVVLPLSLMLASWFCCIHFLVRIFRQEQALVAGTLDGIVRDPMKVRRPARRKPWFVHGSLGEIDLVRASLLKGQDALLHDPLTGIMNRRAFDQHRLRLEQAQLPHWLVLLDLDCFKQINDNWGHRVGDSVLCRVANTLATELGESRVYRIGGDEFAALLPWEQGELAQRLTALLTRVRELQWREFEGAITLSAGGARYPQEQGTLFERADEQLYRSKRQGRDCWHLSPTQSAPKGR